MLVSIEQKLNRWDSLPVSLKEALASGENSQILLDILKKEHIPEEKFEIIALIIGDIIFGFKHSEDLTKELMENIKVVRPLAEALAEQINRKIFLPVKEDLRTVYSPVLIKKPETSSVQAVGTEIAKIAEMKPEEIIPAALEQQEKKEDDNKIDLSSLTKIDSVAPFAKEPAEITEEPFAASIATEFTEDEPAIIHKEEKLKPISKIKSSLSGFLGFGRNEPIKKEEQKSVIAKIEMEIPQELKEQFEQTETAKTEAPKFKIVHYSDLRTPLDNLGGEIAQPGFNDTKPKEETILPSEQEKILESMIIEPEKNQEVVIKKEELEKVIIKDYTAENGLKDQQEKIEDTVVLKKPEILISKEIKPEEVKLEDIPVNEDVIDLRSLDLTNNQRPTTNDNG